MENGREETQEHHNPVTVVDGRDIAELVKKEAAFSRYVDHKFQELDRDGNGKLLVKELEPVVSLSSRSVFSLSSRWFLSLSFSLVLHLPSPCSVFFTPIFILSHRSLAIANSFSAISISFLVSSRTCSAYAFSAAASRTCSAA